MNRRDRKRAKHGSQNPSAEPPAGNAPATSAPVQTPAPTATTVQPPAKSTSAADPSGKKPNLPAETSFLMQPAGLFWLLVAMLLAMMFLSLTFFAHRQLIICVVTFAAVLLLTVHPALHRHREMYPATFSALATITSTFAAVYLGLYYAGLNEKVSEKSKVIQLLLTADTDLDLVGRHAKIFQKDMADEQKYKLVANDPLPRPELLDSLLSSELVLRNISPQSFAALVTVKNDSTRLASNVNNQRIPWKSLPPHLTSYRQVLMYGRGIIDYELKYQNGEITHEELRSRLKTLLENRLEQAPPELRRGMTLAPEGEDWKKGLKVDD
jgi:hypothetical protein